MDSVFQRLGMEYQDNQCYVVISRHWSRPEITVSVNREKIEIAQSIEVFIENLHMELAIPEERLTWKERITGVFKPNRDKVLERLVHAAQRVIDKSKEASSQVM